MNWKKITLFKYQQIETINADKKFDELEKVLFSACVAFGLTEQEMDAKGLKQVAKMIKRIKRLFTTSPAVLIPKRIGRYWVLYDVSRFTFGQYVVLAFFLQQPTKNMHYILASCSRRLLRKYATTGHPARADRFLGCRMEQAVGAVKVIKERFEAFN